MTQASAAEWELAIVLPLDAVVSQLRRIEAQLRLLNMKALDFARERENRTLHRMIEMRLERISETLASVAGLVVDIEADIAPSRAKVTRVSIDEDTASLPSHAQIDDARSPGDVERSAYSPRKANADRDD
jgi:hypothetical protein